MESMLSPAAITDNLATRFVGQRVLYYPSLPSTMDAAREAAQKRAAEGTVVIAGEQTAGRGRLKRTWLSPRGSLALSLILYPEVARLSCLIMLASLAVSHSIEALTGLKPRLKWPNDVLLNGKKVCGILVESSVHGNAVEYAIIGIGINVNLRLADFPELSIIATSLSEELGREVSRLELVRQLLVELEKLYLRVRAGESLYEEWRDSLETLGKKVRVTFAKAVEEGVAESVDEDGSLLLRHTDGSLVRIVAGDVTLRE